MAVELNFSKFSNDLTHGIVGARVDIEFNKVKEEDIESTKEHINFLEKLQTTLYPIMRLSFSDVYEHAENLSDRNSPSNFHKSLADVDDDDYTQIIDAIDTYFNQKEIRSKELDWMYIDAFIFQFYWYTKHSGEMEIVKKYEPLYHKVAVKNSDFIVIQSILIFVWKIIKWILWAGAIIMCFLIGSDSHGNTAFTLTGFLLLIFKAFFTWRKISNGNKDAALLEGKLKMIEKAYTNLSRIDFNKQLLVNDLLQCRNNGIDVPNIIFSAIG